MAGGGQRAGTTQTVENINTGPWAGAAPYIANQFARSDQLYNQGPYTGSYLTAQSPYTLQAQQMQAQKALDPNSLISQSQGVLSDTLAGKYMSPNSNPYLAGSVDQALGQAKSAFAGQYGGAAGSNLSNSGYQEQLARTLASTALPFYMSNYQNERARQLNAMSLAPSLDVANINELANVGTAQEQRGQAEITAGQQQYYAPWDLLYNYGRGITGQFPSQGASSGSKSSPYFSNPLAQAMGLGIGGMQLYNSLYGNNAAGGGAGGYSYFGSNQQPYYTEQGAAGGGGYSAADYYGGDLNYAEIFGSAA